MQSLRLLGLMESGSSIAVRDIGALLGGQRRAAMSPQACEMCRRRKIRCELEDQTKACVQCLHRNMRCVFSPRRSKRESLKRAHHIKGLETRLRQVESLLRAAGVLPRDYVDVDIVTEGGNPLESSDNDSDEDYERDESANPILDSLNGSSLDNDRDSTVSDYDMNGQTASNISVEYLPKSADSHSSSNTEEPSEGAEDSKLVDSAYTGNNLLVQITGGGEPYYIGCSSGFSIFSQSGIQWIREKTGDRNFGSGLLAKPPQDTPWSYWRPDVFHDLFSCRVFKPLPPRSEVFFLLKIYFRTSNRLFPIYHEETFMNLVEWQYTQQTCDDPARWASINILLAIAYRTGSRETDGPEKSSEKAWMYFKNAASVLTDLTLRRCGLLSAQALVGMALFLRTHCWLGISYRLAMMAIRACHQIGLHRRVSRSELSPAEQEQRKRVFWTAFILDHSASIRVGTAPAQDVEDFDVDLPSAEDRNEIADPDHLYLRLFKLLCRLCVIKSRIYRRLYAAISWLKPLVEIRQVVKTLNAELADWRQESPLADVEPFKEYNDDPFGRYWCIHLQLGYYQSLVMINQIPLVYDDRLSNDVNNSPQQHTSGRNHDDQLYESAHTCLQAARESLKLANKVPREELNWIWSLLYYVFLAAVIVFTGILRDPRDRKVKENLQSLNMAANFFTEIVPFDGGSINTKVMADICSMFERIASKVIEKEEKELGIRERNQNSLRKNTSITTSPKHHSIASSVRDQDLNITTTHPSGAGPSGAVYVPGIEASLPMNSSGYTITTNASNSDSFIGLAIPEDTRPQEMLNYERQNLTQLHASLGFPPPLSNTYSLHNETPASRLWHIPITAEWDLPPGGYFPQGYFGGYGQPASSLAVGELERGLAEGHNQHMPRSSLWNQGLWSVTK